MHPIEIYRSRASSFDVPSNIPVGSLRRDMEGLDEAEFVPELRNLYVGVWRCEDHLSE